ncbi:ATP-dependent nuclease [Rheinheimera faecalis]
MALEYIEIIGYRGFKKKAHIDLAIPDGKTLGSGLTVFTGPNNAGKSSVLECMRARNGYETPSFSAGVRNASVDQVDITYSFDGQIESIKSTRKGSSEVSLSGTQSQAKIFVLPSRRAFNPYFGRGLNTREQHIQNSGLPSQRGAILSGFESRLFNILRDLETSHAFNKLLAEVLGFEPEWSIDQSEQGNYFLKFFSSNHSHSSDGMGEGIVSIFAIIDSLYDSSPNDIVVIDEPELSLHPALQKRLAALLLRLSCDRQIVISTHSPYFVDLKAIRGGAKLVRIVSGIEGTEVYALSAESIAAINTLSNNNLYNPHVFGLDARELFFQEEGIILTEGQEDVLLLPKIAAQLEEKVEGHFFGWGVGGAGNIRHLCRILSDLGFKKVAAVLDGDKLQEVEYLKEHFPDYFACAIPAEDIRTKEPRKATEGVDGILDRKLQVRAEHAEKTRQVLSSIRGYMMTPCGT